MIETECPLFVTHDGFIVEQVAAIKMPLVDKFYQSQGYKIKCGRHERVFSLTHPSYGIVGAARLVPQADDYWLRNMLIASELRHHGLGTLFIKKILSELQPGNCYCFSTTHAEAFYTKLKFQHLTPEECNTLVAARYEQYRSRGRDWILMGFLWSKS